jgi:glycosyltransferase involved in cell wall biosynthesis
MDRISGADLAPQIVVIVPIYKHSALVAEAIESVLDQQCPHPIAMLLVSDGCPHPETDAVASTYATVYQNIFYFRNVNGGPSAARNFGIDYALSAWPSLDAVYFLDADNRLSSTAMATAYACLKQTNDVSWVYPNIDSFGIGWSGSYSPPYSRLLHVIHDNICDTGSLVSREVFESGVRFDTDSKSGYEDWDFWLQCIAHGFRGKHCNFGFEYRQRAESRFREVNRDRAATLAHLRRRHKGIARPEKLLQWEHEESPRYAIICPTSSRCHEVTDPTLREGGFSLTDLLTRFWQSVHLPDEKHLAPFFCWVSSDILKVLEDHGVIFNIFWLMERLTRENNFVALSLASSPGKIGVQIRTNAELRENPSGAPASRAVAWMARSRIVQEICEDPGGEGWINSLAAEVPGPTVAEIVLSLPTTDVHTENPSGTLAGLLETFALLRSSRSRDVPRKRWRWRPQQLPDRRDYYRILCESLEVTGLMPRVSDGRPDAGFVVPFASFGGAEKVGYALARTLRAAGFRTHLFIVGSPVYNIIDEYAAAFDTVNFLADASFPVWGGSSNFYGHDIFLPGSPEVKESTLKGLLTNLDVLVNCQSAPMNSVMGSIRSMGTITASYLHVVDATATGRVVGHPYITVGFEHAYDLVLTCSNALAEYLHSLGIPADKIMHVPNAAGFTVPASTRADMAESRAEARGQRPLRALYIGRLDRQKGVERLYSAISIIRQHDLPIEFRVIGAQLVEGDDTNPWNKKFLEQDVLLEPPLFSSDELSAAFKWADCLILPSRWEGAPLVIPEAQQLGCIPICTDVGAVSELLSDEQDGLLVADGADDDVAESIAECLEQLVSSDKLRSTLALGALKRSEDNHWEANFRPLIQKLFARLSD